MSEALVLHGYWRSGAAYRVRIALALKEAGTISRAAQLLNVTQSALSHQVLALERQYDAVTAGRASGMSDELPSADELAAVADDLATGSFGLAIADKHHIRPMFVLFDAVWDPQPHLGLGPGEEREPHVEVLVLPGGGADVGDLAGRVRADPAHGGHDGRVERSARQLAAVVEIAAQRGAADRQHNVVHRSAEGTPHRLHVPDRGS